MTRPKWGMVLALLLAHVLVLRRCMGTHPKWGMIVRGRRGLTRPKWGMIWPWLRAHGIVGLLWLPLRCLLLGVPLRHCLLHLRLVFPLPSCRCMLTGS